MCEQAKVHICERMTVYIQANVYLCVNELCLQSNVYDF